MAEDKVTKSALLPSKHSYHTRNRSVAQGEEFKARVEALAHHGDLAPLLTSRDLCVFLGVGYLTVTKWRRIGVGPPWINVSYGNTKRTAQIRYDYRDVVNWLEDRKQMPKGYVKPGMTPVDNSHLVFRK